ncbi:hypothetical protein [Faecalibacterium sp. PGM34]
MKKNQIRKSVAALAMAAVVSVSLLGYGCGSKPASSTAGACPASSPAPPRVWAAMLPSL